MQRQLLRRNISVGLVKCEKPNKCLIFFFFSDCRSSFIDIILLVFFSSQKKKRNWKPTLWMIISSRHPCPICTSIYARKYKFLYFNVMSQVEDSSAKQSFNCSRSTYLFFIAVFYKPCCTMYRRVLDKDMICEPSSHIL